MDANQVIGLIISFFLVFGIPGLIIYWIGKKIYNKIQLSRLRKKEAIETQNRANFRNQLIDLYKAKRYSELLDLTSDYSTEEVDELQIIGLSLFQTGEHERGEKVFMKAFALTGYGDKNPLRLNLGKCWFNAKEYRRAIKYLQEISYDDLKFDFSQGNYEAPFMTGLCYFKLGKHEAALEALKKAPVTKKDVNKNLNEIIQLMGECYEEMGNKKMAIKYYNKALSNDISLIELEEKIIELEGKEV